MEKPLACPHCGARGSLTGVGPGVERLAEEVHTRFRGARVEILSSDTVASAEDRRSLIARMETGAIDILIGTQIVAKGHNFPTLTLVGVVDADAGLRGGYLRAGERTFPLLLPVAGRAGRAGEPGRAIRAPYAPETPPNPPPVRGAAGRRVHAPPGTSSPPAMCPHLPGPTIPTNPPRGLHYSPQCCGGHTDQPASGSCR